MPSTYTSNNKIQKIATGEQSGTWGNTTNTNFDLFDTAIDGFVSIALSGTTYSLNIPDGTASDARNKVISFTGTLAAANTVTVTPNTVEKLYFFQNNTTGGQNVIIAQGSGSTVTIKPGYSSIVYLNGAGSGAAVKEVLTSLKLTALLEATGVVFVGSGSGNTTLQAAATASGTLTLPAATDTIVGRSTTDTLSNKTLATPVITTNATVPLLIGGTGVLSTLTLRSTSGVGTTGADIVFQTGTNGATEVMRLQNGGNIGIATATPAQKLEVFGATSLPATSGTTQNGLLRIASTATNAIDMGLSNASPFGAWIQTSNVLSLATTYPLLLNPNGGNVGIGTTNPGRILDVRGLSSFSDGTQGLIVGAYTGGSGYGMIYRFGTTPNGTNYVFGANSTETILNNPSRLTFAVGGVEGVRLEVANNLKVGGTADRATTAGTNQVVIFNGAAPVGTLANGCSFYSTAGEMRVMDAAGNATLLSPHDAQTNEWIYDSTHSPTGKRLKINVEKLLRFVNQHFGLDCVLDEE